MRARLLGSVLAAVFSVAVAFGALGGSDLDALDAQMSAPPDSGWTAPQLDSGWTGTDATPADSGWTKVVSAEAPPDSGWTSIPADAEA